MNWEIKTYQNRYAAGDLTIEDALDAKVIGGVFRVHCPECGLWVQPFVMIDCRTWPSALVGGLKFVCDGCWTRWEREGKTFDDPGDAMTGRAPQVSRQFDEAVSYELAGAPPELIETSRAIIERRKARFADSEGARQAARSGVRNLGGDQ